MFRHLCEVLAQSRNNDLRRQVQFLKAENKILRSRVMGPVRTTRAERDRLVRLGKTLGSALNQVISIVSPRTFARWLSDHHRAGRRMQGPRPNIGRPRKPEATRRLVLRLARETGWGYTRLLGELHKLGTRISKTTLRNILREAGIPTSPSRSDGTWDQFLKAHAKTLWACDFVSKPIWTLRGRVQAFLLVFIHVQSRRVHVSVSTTKPDGEWVATQMAVFALANRKTPQRPTVLLRDRDSKFGAGVDDSLRAVGIEPLKLPPRSPNLNAFVERFILTLQVECLDRFIVLGTDHLNYLAGEFVDYYNRQRPHSRIGFRALTQTQDSRALDPPAREEVRCLQRLGGVIRHYHRKAA